MTAAAIRCTDLRRAFIAQFPDWARRVSAELGVTPEDLGMPSTDEGLAEYAGRAWDERH